MVICFFGRMRTEPVSLESSSSNLSFLDGRDGVIAAGVGLAEETLDIFVEDSWRARGFDRFGAFDVADDDASREFAAGDGFGNFDAFMGRWKGSEDKTTPFVGAFFEAFWNMLKMSGICPAKFDV